MKTHFARVVVVLALMLSSTSARAEFEIWNTKLGTPAKMEITGLEEGPDGAKVHFRTKDGKEIKVKLEHLFPEGQARARAWKEGKTGQAEKAKVAKPPVEATFAYATDWAARASAIDPSVSVLQFVFDLKSDCGLAGDLEVSNATVSVGGKKLEVGTWQGFVYNGGNEFSPDRAPPPAPPDKWSIIITALGDFGKVDPAACEFSADVEVTCGKSPKEVRTMMPLPKGKSTEENPTGNIELKVVEPFDIEIVKKSYPSLTRIGDSVTGYYLAVMPNDEKMLADARLWATFSEVFIANGKEYRRCLLKDEATDPVQVVVKYWSEVYKVPLHLSKAASNKGRTPPRKGAVDGVPRERKGG